MTLTIPDSNGKPAVFLEGSPEELIKTIFLLNKTASALTIGGPKPPRTDNQPGNPMFDLLMNALLNQTKKEDKDE